MLEWSGWADFPVGDNMRTADLERMGEGRPSGLHLSDLIKRMKVAAGENVEPVPGDQEGVRPQVGFIWETALEYMQTGLNHDEAMDLAFKRYAMNVKKDIVTQVRLEKDGIHMTPDAICEKVGELYSFKATYRSFRNAREQEDFEAKFWTWVVQEMSYCWAAGVDTAHWVVLWVVGDYTYPMRPLYLQATAKFSAEELAENWANVLSYARILAEKREMEGV